MEILDCRGLDCPQPVIRTKAEIDRGLNELIVRVENEAAAENVTGFMKSQGFSVIQERLDKEFFLLGQRTGAARAAEADPGLSEWSLPREKVLKTCVLITTDRIGQGDGELGRKLMNSYLATLKEMGPGLWRIILLNAGVRLAVEGADTVEPLNELEKEEISILVCGTCLNYYDLLEKKAVGETTNMLDVVTSLEVADKVISLN